MKNRSHQSAIKIASITILALALELTGLLTSLVSADPFIPTFQQISPDVWTAVRKDNPRYPVMGTATFVLSDAGVVVYDGGGTALMAERIISKIKSLTDKPVTHVVISHWHGDHNFGIYRYLEEYSNVQVVSHTFTYKAMTSKRIRYIDKFPDSTPKLKIKLEESLKNKTDLDGGTLTAVDKKYYTRLLADSDIIHKEYNRVKVTIPTITFDEKLVIHSGDKIIELLYLGDANTAGDIVMWLPEAKIVSTGDIVVHPIPYAFNVPPRKWSRTLSNINALGYNILVPGHGEIQRNTKFVDLIIEASTGIADQRDALLKKGVTQEAAKKQLDFSPYEKRFTNNDAYVTAFFKEWFETPFRDAVFKALTGEPMVVLEPVDKEPEVD